MFVCCPVNSTADGRLPFIFIVHVRNEVLGYCSGSNEFGMFGSNGPVVDGK